MAEKDEVVIGTGAGIAVEEDATMTDKEGAEETFSMIAEGTDAMTTDEAVKNATSSRNSNRPEAAEVHPRRSASRRLT